MAAATRKMPTMIVAPFDGGLQVLTALGRQRVAAGQIRRDFRIFADDKIRYHGDVVALVVA